MNHETKVQMKEYESKKELRKLFTPKINKKK